MKPIKTLKQEHNTKQTGFLKASRVWFVFAFIVFGLALAILAGMNAATAQADTCTGTLTCSNWDNVESSCTTSGCTWSDPRCTANSELCSNWNNNEQNCTISGCGWCGDSIINGNEVCDYNNAPQACLTSDNYAGTQACLLDCNGYDTCISTGSEYCGDNIINGNEFCDGTALMEQDCTTIGQGFTSGTLACLGDCMGFDTNGCYTCGNNLKEGTEVCDGFDLGTETCQSQGYASGDLVCAVDCGTFDTSGCYSQFCGDGIKTCACGDTIVGDYTLGIDLDCSGLGGYGLIIGANNTVVDCSGQTISGDSGNNGGIFLSGHSNVTIENCIIIGFPIGIYSEYSNNVRMINNTIYSNNNEGIFIDRDRADVIQGNNISYNEDKGIYSVDSVDISILGNTIDSNEEGIFIDRDWADVIQGNNISNNIDMGIFSVWSGFSQILENNITDNGWEFGEWMGSGIFLVGETDGNYIYGSSNTIEHNTLTNNYYNDILTWNSYDNIISYNNFTNIGEYGLSVVNYENGGWGHGYSYDYIENNTLNGTHYYGAITTDTNINSIIGNIITCEGDCSTTAGIDLSKDWSNNYGIFSTSGMKNMSVSSILEETYNITLPTNTTGRHAQENIDHSSFVTNMLDKYGVGEKLATALESDNSSFDVNSIYDDTLNYLQQNEVSGTYYGLYADRWNWHYIAWGENYYDNVYGIYAESGWRQVIANSNIHSNCVGLYSDGDRVYSINTNYTSNQDHTIFGDSNCLTELESGDTGNETGGIYAYGGDITVINGNFVNNGDVGNPWAMYDNTNSISWHVSEPIDCINNTVTISGVLTGNSNINAVDCLIIAGLPPTTCGGDVACQCGDTLTETRILNEADFNEGICTGNGLNIGTNDIVLDCNGVSITGNNGYDGIYASGKNITIRNCTIVDFANGIYSEWSGSTSSESSDGTVITNNTITGNWEGIFLSNDGGDIIWRNDISGNGDAGIVAEGKIRTWNNQIIENNLEENVYVNVGGLSWGCDYCSAISLQYEDSDVIAGNTITGSWGNGINLNNSRDTQILGNYLNGNYYDNSGNGYGNFQINIDAKDNDLGFGSDNNIQGNTLIDSTDAAVSLYTDRNTVTNNTIDCEGGDLGTILNYESWLNIVSNGISNENISAADKQALIQFLTTAKTSDKHKTIIESLPPVNEHWKEYAANGTSGFSVSAGDGHNYQLYGNSFSENTVSNCDIGFGAIDSYASTINHDTYQGNDLGMLVMNLDAYTSVTIINAIIDSNCAGALLYNSDVHMNDTNITNNNQTSYNNGDGTCDVPIYYGSGLKSFGTALNLVNGNYENNPALSGADGLPYGVYDVYDEASLLVKQDVACTNNDLRVGSIIPLGGGIIPTNCIVSVWNSSSGSWQALNLTGGQIGYTSLPVITGLDNQTTIGGFDYGAGLDIYTDTPVVSGNVDITYYDANPGGPGYSLSSLGRYVTLTPDGTTDAALDYIILKMYYTDAEIAAAGLDENSLRIEYYNDSDGTWHVFDPPEGGVNTTGKYVWANVTHFSLYGLFGATKVNAGPAGGPVSSGIGPTKAVAQNATTTPTALTCTPNWNCTSFTACVNGTMTRTCTDLNSCGTSESKPAEVTSCITKKQQILAIVIGMAVIAVLAMMAWGKKKKRLS